MLYFSFFERLVSTIVFLFIHLHIYVCLFIILSCHLSIYLSGYPSTDSIIDSSILVLTFIIMLSYSIYIYLIFYSLDVVHGRALSVATTKCISFQWLDISQLSLCFTCFVFSCLSMTLCSSFRRDSTKIVKWHNVSTLSLFLLAARCNLFFNVLVWKDMPGLSQRDIREFS